MKQGLLALSRLVDTLPDTIPIAPFPADNLFLNPEMRKLERCFDDEILELTSLENVIVWFRCKGEIHQRGVLNVTMTFSSLFFG